VWALSLGLYVHAKISLISEKIDLLILKSVNVGGENNVYERKIK
jgi:hypothetical protein